MKLDEKWESIAWKTGAGTKFLDLSHPEEIDICEETKRNKDPKTILFLVGVPPESEVRFSSNAEITEFMSWRITGLVFTAWRPPKDHNLTLLMTFVVSECDQMFEDNTSVSRTFNTLYPLVGDCPGQTILLEPLVKGGGRTDCCNYCNPTLLQPNNPVFRRDDDVTTQNTLSEISKRNEGEILPRCDGTTNNSVFIDRCGHCVQGLTKSATNVSNVCGECDVTSCLGCDGKPNSGWKLHTCGQCKPPGEGKNIISNIKTVSIVYVIIYLLRGISITYVNIYLITSYFNSLYPLLSFGKKTIYALTSSYNRLTCNNAFGITHFEPETSRGQDLLDVVIKHLNLLESAYFGLRFVDSSGQTHWLDSTKNVVKQLKDSSPCTLYFNVKFYASDPCKLVEETTR
ncbi:uncharacterized protein LOC143240704 [Tachypleus tridentatus]|uniref:uncharacterized protein LOC143240704 n=1 Tax=Tachypleus tridentatus TaxID=6853 RepID=UPI003FD24B11